MDQIDMTYLNHLTLNTGHNRRSKRGEVSDATLAVLHPYLAQCLARPGRHPLPVPALSHYSMRATLQDGALMVTVYGPSGPHIPGQHALGGDGIPLVTFGVAQRSRHGGELWAMMVAQFGAALGLARPSEPWCAVAVHAAVAGYPRSLDWLGDFERCVAWAWITRNPVLSAADEPR